MFLWAFASLRFKSFEREDRFDAMTDTIQTFLAMGGYAKFVWPAYALAAIVLVGLLVISLRQLRKTEAELAALGLSRPRERA
jgi:heme exporter protein CcmD